MSNLTDNKKDFAGTIENKLDPLRDLDVLNASSSLPSVIHARKASTYLRIFRDDENTSENEQIYADKDMIAAHKDLKNSIRICEDYDSNENISSIEDDMFQLKSSSLNGYHNGISSLSESDITYLKKKKESKLYSSVDNIISPTHDNSIPENIDISLDYSNNNISDNIKPLSLSPSGKHNYLESRIKLLKAFPIMEQEFLYDGPALEPVSSATYYPHRSKSAPLKTVILSRKNSAIIGKKKDRSEERRVGKEG